MSEEIIGEKAVELTLDELRTLYTQIKEQYDKIHSNIYSPFATKYMDWISPKGLPDNSIALFRFMVEEKPDMSGLPELQEAWSKMKSAKQSFDKKMKEFIRLGGTP